MDWAYQTFISTTSELCDQTKKELPASQLWPFGWGDGLKSMPFVLIYTFHKFVTT